MKNAKTTAIIGGGAAGLAAACFLARAGVKTVLLEKQSRVGRKLLSTGNGRCNLSNLHAAPENYHGGAEAIRAALAAFPPEKTVGFFESLGVRCVPDEEGRVYPAGNAAAGVLDALRLYADEHGCETVAEFDAVKLQPKGNRYEITAADGRRIEADFVIVACGGLAAPKLGGGSGGYKLLEALGHRITPKYPAIAALKTDPEAVRALKGIRMHGEISLVCEGKTVRTEKGEILFGDGAISGIAAMQLAREVNLRLNRKQTCDARLNFLPGAAADAIDARANLLPKRTMDDFLSGLVPKRLGQVIIKEAGISPLTLLAEELMPAQRDSILKTLTGWTLSVRGTLGFDAAQVTCGGADLRDFDARTLESKKARNVFAAGEVLDVDGDCGGFNLQWAWSSAVLCAAEILARNKT